MYNRLIVVTENKVPIIKIKGFGDLYGYIICTIKGVDQI